MGKKVRARRTERANNKKQARSFIREELSTWYNMDTKLAAVTKTATRIAGIPVDITIRGEKKFTFYYEGINHVARNRLVDFFSPAAMVAYDENEDLGTFIYVNLY